LRAPVAAVYRNYAWIMPRSRAELRASWAASVVAGCGEEVAFRGFLLWYCAAAVGAPAGLLATSLLFGAAHSYQRGIGMAFATLAGLVLGGFYLASGSLILAMWMHATWNVASFAAGRMVLGAGEGGEGPL
jgi:membrane protease YdiL (CAAX protease family)